MLQILIVDDHTIFRVGLKHILEKNIKDITIDESAESKKAIEMALNNLYDLVILDISLPGRSGLDILKQIKAKKPKLPVLMLSMYPEEQYAVRALKAGASGYLTKESDADIFIEAIEKILEGNKFITPSLAEKLATTLDGNIKQFPHETLSDREYQVMCLIARGKTLKEISEDLLLSINTIKTYRARILEKMRIKNNADIIYYAIKYDLIN